MTTLTEESTSLEHLPGGILDADIGEGDVWVAVCAGRERPLIASVAGTFEMPAPARCPMVRRIDDDRFLVVDARTSKDRPNGWIFSSDGRVLATFLAGDGVEDIVICGHRIVVSYFDEGVFGDVPPSAEGIAVFSHLGELEWGYQSGVRSPVDVVDCYALCHGGPDQVYFTSYTGFPLVRLNVRTREQEVWELPSMLAGAAALTTDGKVFWFYSPYEAKRRIIQWSPGEAPVDIGGHAGPLRAAGRARFLSAGKAGYTLVHPRRT
jgi:hypothetical protein